MHLPRRVPPAKLMGRDDRRIVARRYAGGVDNKAKAAFRRSQAMFQDRPAEASTDESQPDSESADNALEGGDLQDWPGGRDLNPDNVVQSIKK